MNREWESRVTRSTKPWLLGGALIVGLAAAGGGWMLTKGRAQAAPAWTSPPTKVAVAAAEEVKVIRDAVGNVLQDGDTVTVVKDLKVKGSSSVVKVGTKVKNIRLVDGDHDIDCKIDGFGQMGLKSEFVKKV